jgi:valyl-tRNA synthetase
VLVGADADVQSRATRWDETLNRLARLSEISFAQSPPKSSAQLLVRGVLAAIPLEGVIDLDAEKKRLKKEIDKLDGDAKKLAAKLANPGFLAKAEEEVIEETKERVDEARARIEKLAAALSRLG